MRLWNGSMTALAVAGLLAGCNKAPDNAAAQTGNATAADSNAALPALPQALPMETGAATSLGLAPPASALRARTPVQIAGLASSSDSYAYLDRAAGQSDAYGDAPPDYAFDYDGVSPWVWQAGDGSTEYAEPVDGGYRSYYYQPGADEPYLVRDGDYSYAYAGAALVAIYLGGRLLTRQQWGDHARYAAGYRDRAENLYHASRDNRRGVIAANWAARRDQIAQQRGAWAAERAQQADWAAYHRDHAAQEQDHWAQDRQQRAVAAQRFDAWRQQDYRGQAPYARPGPGPAPQDRAQDRQPDRQPDNRQPPHPQPATQPTPDRRPDARPDARPMVATPGPRRPSGRQRRRRRPRSIGLSRRRVTVARRCSAATRRTCASAMSIRSMRRTTNRSALRPRASRIRAPRRPAPSHPVRNSTMRNSLVRKSRLSRCIAGSRRRNRGASARLRTSRPRTSRRRARRPSTPPRMSRRRTSIRARLPIPHRRVVASRTAMIAIGDSGVA